MKCQVFGCRDKSETTFNNTHVCWVHYGILRNH